MKTINKWTAALMTALALVSVNNAEAGNEQRVGQAGSTQLQINPWARSSGMGYANASFVKGLESTFSNVAGLAFTDATELIFANTNYMTYGNNQSAATISNFGLAQKVGESGVLGITIMSMGFGDIPITTENLPEGGIGNYTISLSNLGISYSKEFSNSIYGGVLVRTISEKMYNMGSQGVCFDAGIQYVTGEKDHIHFGVSLKNVGSKMMFDGDGVTFRGIEENGDYTMTLSQRTDNFELPSMLNIALGYDLPMLPESHRLSTGATFTSNSFQNDQYRFGMEYSFKDYVMLRFGYVYQKDIANENTTAAISGPSAGLTFEVPMGETSFGVDYSYRASSVFQGNHAVGVRIDL
jgi:hypothetical protein